MSSIFIQIGSYHDLELAETIKEALAKSSGKTFLHFGVHNCFYESNQFDENELRYDLNLLNKNYKLSIAYSKFPKNIGVGKSRYIANKFYNNEDYYLQIDSHIMLMWNWDLFLIEQLEYAKKQKIKKPVISLPLNKYYVNEKNERKLFSPEEDFFVSNTIDIESYVKKNPPIFNQYKLYDLGDNNEPNKVYEACFGISIPSENLSKLFEYIYVNGAFIFGDGTLAQIEPNKKILYLGDEFINSIRLYTHGYTVLRAGCNYVAFHLTRSAFSYDNDGWKTDRRRSVYDDFNYLIKAEQLSGSEDHTIEETWRHLFDESILELRFILTLRPKGRQYFGNELDSQNLIDSLFFD